MISTFGFGLYKSKNKYMKTTILILLLLFGMYSLLYLPDEHHILYIILFIPYIGFVINEFRKMKKKE